MSKRLWTVLVSGWLLVMSKRLWPILLSGWILTLGGAWGLGHWQGKRARLNAYNASIKAQVECLRRMWGPHPFTPEELSYFRSCEYDPEAVRSFLYSRAKLHDIRQWVPISPANTHVPDPEGIPFLDEKQLYQGPLTTIQVIDKAGIVSTTYRRLLDGALWLDGTNSERYKAMEGWYSAPTKGIRAADVSPSGTFPPPPHTAFLPGDIGWLRAALLLESWTPGQTTFREPFPQKEPKQ